MTAPLTIVANEPARYLSGFLNYDGERWSAGSSTFLITPNRYESGYHLIDVTGDALMILENTSYEKCLAWLNDSERPWNWETEA